MAESLYLAIADIIISITSTINKCRFIPCGPQDFFLKDLISKEPDINLTFHYGSIPDFELSQPIFADKNLDWSLYRSNKHYILKAPHRLMIVDSEFSSGDIYVRRSSPEIFRRYPIQHPLDRILIIYKLLSKKQGLMIHSCGIKNKKRGLLFVGSSGAGKSTIANLLKTAKGMTILSDDRIIIRRKNRRFLIYGTPWYGDAKVCSPEKAPLEKIFFLKHAKENSVKKLEPLDVAFRLIACSFLPFWDKKIMECILEFCSQIAEQTLCYELGFVPDKSIISFC